MGLRWAFRAFSGVGRSVWHAVCFQRAAVEPGTDRSLNELVRRCVPSLVDLLESRDRYLQAHVVRYLDRFGTCGDPTLGFALLRCVCGRHKVLSFRCHGRALCPTCGGRAMASGAAHLVDRVLPDVTVRQWVLSVPWPRRYLFARRPELCAGARRRVWRQLSRWYARRAEAVRGERGGSTGAVVVVQRFGSALNLNVHFHMLLLDGVFVPDDSEPRGVRWVRVPAPSTEEVQALVVELARDLEAWLSREGYGTDEASEEDEDDDSDAPLFAASIAGRVAMGTRAGAKVRSLQSAPARPFRLPERCGEASGYIPVRPRTCTRRWSSARATGTVWSVSAGTCSVRRWRRPGSSAVATGCGP